MKWDSSNEISEILTEGIKLSDNMLSAHEHAELGFYEDFESDLLNIARKISINREDAESLIYETNEKLISEIDIMSFIKLNEF